MNDDGTFSKSFNCIYPGELETKLEQSGGHACFLDLFIKIEDGVFAYKLFDKRDKFPSTIFCCSLYIQKYTETGAFSAHNRQIEVASINILKVFQRFFLTTIWLPHCQLWAIIEGAASLTQC